MNTETKLARINALQVEKATLQQIIDGHTSAFSFSQELNKKLQEIQEKYINPLLTKHADMLKAMDIKYSENIHFNIGYAISEESHNYGRNNTIAIGAIAMRQEIEECELRISQINEEIESILGGYYYKKVVKFVYRTGHLTENVLLTSEIEENVYKIICKVMQKVYGSKAKMFSILFGLDNTSSEYINWTMREIVRVYSSHRLETTKTNAKKILGDGIEDLYEISDLVDLLP